MELNTILFQAIGIWQRFRNRPYSSEEWLDNFSTFSIYQILSQLIELWGLNIKSEEVPKKRKTNDYALIPFKGSRTWSFCFWFITSNDWYCKWYVYRKNNDEYKYKEVATQEDFDKF